MREKVLQPWITLALFAFLLHFVWENVQTPLYDGMTTAPHWEAVMRCGQATVGDVLITLVAYAGVAAFLADRFWLADPKRGRVAVFLIIGVTTTVVLELLNVHVWGGWTYGRAMPTVLGIGLSPLLQWMVLPLTTLWLARRHLGYPPASSARHPA